VDEALRGIPFFLFLNTTKFIYTPHLFLLMDHRDKLLSIVKEKGPLLPAQINKEMRTNVLFASAMLSEMVDQKKLRLTSMKVGGSHKMNEKDYRTFELLKKTRVMRDRDQDPQIRVSLRELKDFAIPLEVTVNGGGDLFWKFYLVSDDEAKSVIKDYLNSKLPAKEMPAQAKTPEKAKEVQSTIPPVKKEEQKIRPEPKPEVRPEAQVASPQKPVTSVKMTTLEESKVPEFSYEPSVSFSTTIDTEEKVQIEKKPEPEPEPEPEPLEASFPQDDDFFEKVRSFFDASGIEILEFNLVRKGTEYDFVINLPSNVGTLMYYCKAKSKAKVSDGDLSTAFVYGQMKKLPILFLTLGDMTKRAEELLATEFKSMFVRKIQ
jgi:hypothetical protein